MNRSEIRIERCRDYEALTSVWHESVRATHDFLREEDIEFYRRKIPAEYLPQVEVYAVRNDEGELCAFIGLGEETVEMLFVSPSEMGRGYGSLLLEFAVMEKGARKVDVNEQNPRALGFYRRRGFTVTGRDSVDSEGKPYPVLHLELTGAKKNYSSSRRIIFLP